MKKHRLGIFVSGTGSNAMNIIDHFAHNQTVEVGFVLTNNPSSPVIAACESKGVKTIVISNEQAAQGGHLCGICEKENINWIILAGYLRLIPAELVHAFNDRIFNIHPSLLPKFGGKGMYGDHVHKAVLASEERESGITIHLVNEEFDKGMILAQFRCRLSDGDDLLVLRSKIRALEHTYYPVIIEKTILSEEYA